MRKCVLGLAMVVFLFSALTAAAAPVKGTGCTNYVNVQATVVEVKSGHVFDSVWVNMDGLEAGLRTRHGVWAVGDSALIVGHECDGYFWLRRMRKQ